MSWLVALTLGAGYLINKKFHLQQKLDEQVRVFHEEGAKPADPGPTSAAIRDVQQTLPLADQYQDMNIQDLQMKDVKVLQESQNSAAREVQQYEQGQGPIRGVFLVYDNFGV